MNKQKIESMIQTIEMLRRLAFNIHGIIDVIDNENIDLTISALTQQLNNGWIPVDSESPVEKGWYLITAADGGIDLAHWYINEGWKRGHNSEVIAWQPLPEPYKETL